MPGHYGPAGQNRGIGPRAGFARDPGYRIAVTEWNRNGWSTDETRIPPSLGERDWHISVGIGVAGFLHGLMRGLDFLAAPFPRAFAARLLVVLEKEKP